MLAADRGKVSIDHEYFHLGFLQRRLPNFARRLPNFAPQTFKAIRNTEWSRPTSILTDAGWFELYMKQKPMEMLSCRPSPGGGCVHDRSCPAFVDRMNFERRIQSNIDRINKFSSTLL